MFRKDNMRNMKRFILLIITAAVVVSTPGCKDFLDTIPDNRTEIDDISKVTKLLANAYPRRTYGAMLEARCDGMTDYGTTFTGGQQNESFEFMKAGFYWMPQVLADCDDSYERFWEDSYRSIMYANFALDALEEFDTVWTEKQKAPIRAEAKICRAYAHFNLVCLYTNMFQYNRQTTNPGIPYVEEPEDRVFKQYDRETVAVTLTKIEEDLFSEIDNLPGPSGYETPRFRFTREAAIAFAIRFCLFTRDYRGVILYANMLLPNASVFVNTGEFYADGLPKRYVSDEDSAFKSINNKMLDWVEYSSSGTNLYEPGLYFSDPNNRSFLLSSEVESIAMRSFLGTYMTSFAYNMETISEVASENVVGSAWALQALQLSNDHTAFWIKYYEDMLLVNEAAGIGYVYLKVNLFRLEEALLSRAEAKIMLAMQSDDKSLYDSAIDDLNMYISSKIKNYKYSNHRLDRNKITTYYLDKKLGDTESFLHSDINKPIFDGITSQIEVTLAKSLIHNVLDFRRVEFMFEGMRYFDVLRWNIPVTHTRMRDNMQRTLYPQDDSRVLQLPESSILSGLEPNPMKRITEPWPEIKY